MNFDKVAIIVTYNRFELLEKLLNSINKQLFQFDYVYIVDNESAISTKELIYNINPKYVYLDPKENLGCSGGFKFGLKVILKKHANGFVVFLDDDIALLPNFLQVVSENEFLANNSCIIPSKSYEDGSVFYWSPLLTNNKLFVKSNIESPHTGLHNLPLKVDNITFEACILPIDIINKIGLPNDKFFIDGDDYEYGLRISNETSIYKIPQVLVERQIKIEPEFKICSFILFKLKSNRVKLGENRLYYEIRNKYLIAKTLGYSPLYTFFSISPHYFRLMAGLLIFREIKLIRAFHIFLKAHFDGFIGRYGKRSI